MNHRLSVRAEILPAEDLSRDLCDGIRLINLLEVMSNESLGKYSQHPRLRVQKAENVMKSLNFIREHGLQLWNIGAEDILDGNVKLICGLLWTLILRFSIEEINEEGLTAKQGLLVWAQRKTASYEEVHVNDFSSSWSDGLALYAHSLRLLTISCAIIDKYRPDLLLYDSLDKSQPEENLAKAFQIAEEQLGIGKLLEVDDVCVPRPDERSIMTYLAQMYTALSALDKIETAGRRIERFLETVRRSQNMCQSYESRMMQLLQDINSRIHSWKESFSTDSLPDIKQQQSRFASYKMDEKRQWVGLKSDLGSLLCSIQTNLKTYRLKEYSPPAHLHMNALECTWRALVQAEASRSKEINKRIRDIRAKLGLSYADKANAIEMALRMISLNLTAYESAIDNQVEHVVAVSARLKELKISVKDLKDFSKLCEDANVNLSDYSLHSHEELNFEIELAQETVARKLSLLENFTTEDNITNISPQLLDEFESVFHHFDREHKKSLHELEFCAALSSLGVVYGEADMGRLFQSLATVESNKTEVTREEFIHFMVSITEDQNTAEQVFQSFQEVAEGKSYVTESDLRHSLVSEIYVEQLAKTMPHCREGKGYDFETYINELAG